MIVIWSSKPQAQLSTGMLEERSKIAASSGAPSRSAKKNAHCLLPLALHSLLPSAPTAGSTRSDEDGTPTTGWQHYAAISERHN